MRFPVHKYTMILSGFTLRETLLTVGVLIAGLIITIMSVFFNRRNVQRAARQDFEYSCNQVRMKIETRLEEHAQLLRGGNGLFAVSDTVTREEWQGFYVRTKIAEFLPGIQGFGYSLVIRPENLKKHEERFRQVYSDYKPDYKVYPEGEREIYSAIIYLEPHNERNMTALGYDMFNEPVRRKAMEIARDSNISILSGKVTLVQEIDEDVQPGVLMYAPDYWPGMPYNTVEERRAALRGWVYSPYRMRDLMLGIRSNMAEFEQEPLRLRIYDDTLILEANRLYDSRFVDSTVIENPNLQLTLRARFAGKIWTLVFDGRKDELSIFHKSQLFILITGVVITILLFILSMLEMRSNLRARQIELLNTQLARLNDDKDRFITILSHDLKSPFTSILGYLELLSTGIRKYDINQIENHVNTINDAARNTYNLLEDLLMWTRAHSGKIPYNPCPLALMDIYENVSEILLPVADSKEITVEYVGPRDIGIWADKDMLKAILRNLITNAIKFTKPHGVIRMTAAKEDGSTRISISDNGIGISPDRLNSLFDIAKILPTSGTAGEKGSGLGLVLCKEFIERHGGTIWVTSEPGKGSTFSFTLPDQ